MASRSPVLPPPPPTPPSIGFESGLGTSEHSGRRRRKHSGPLGRTWRRLRRPLLWVTVVGAALLALAGIDLAVRYLPAVRALSHGRDASQRAEALLSSDLAHMDHDRLDRAAALLSEARDDFGSRSTILQDGWIAGAFDHLPLASRQVRAVRALRQTGEAGTNLGLDLMPLLGEIVPDPARDSIPPLARITRGAQEQQPALAMARGHLGQLATALREIPDGPLVGPLESARRTALSAGPRVEGAVGPAVSLLRAVPNAIGPGTHTYLLLLENPTEERPAGGFIGAVGEAVFSDGLLSSATFGDPAALNAGIRSEPVPKPLDEHLFRGHPLEFSDANWAADFPTGATEMARLYQMATGHRTDGVISVDPVALGYVLGVRGPMRVPPYPQTITAANTLTELNYIVNQIRPGDPGKPFLPPFGRAMLDALVHAPLDQLPALAQALQRGTGEKHIVLHFANPELQGLVDDGNSGGRITAPLSDALLVDDANLSGTKGDLTVTRSYALTARVDRDGQVHDHLVLRYHNPVPDALTARLDINSGGGYRDYLRVYVPETAELDGMSLSINSGRPNPVVPEDTQWEYERESIAYWLILPRGGDAQLTLDYSGPFADASRGPVRYGLTWTKQVNALTWPISVNVVLPGGRAWSVSSDLDVDRTWDVASG